VPIHDPDTLVDEEKHSAAAQFESNLVAFTNAGNIELGRPLPRVGAQG
jgi:hypothetical protein